MSHQKQSAMNNLAKDPKYYRKLRKKRKSYPQHAGLFTSESASKAGKIGAEKRWQKERSED